jgi:hypothetical protein
MVMRLFSAGRASGRLYIALSGSDEHELVEQIEPSLCSGKDLVGFRARRQRRTGDNAGLRTRGQTGMSAFASRHNQSLALNDVLGERSPFS